MRRLVEWTIANGPGMNTLMVAILVTGALSLATLQRETFPPFSLEIIRITIPYPGASPEEVEEGIVQKVEEALRPIEGIERMTSIAGEGVATIVLELDVDADEVEDVLAEVRSEIDRLSTLPELAEDPTIQQQKFTSTAIFVGVAAPRGTSFAEAELQLRNTTEEIRDELLELETVSLVTLYSDRDYQIDIQIPEDVLREHGLTLAGVARTIRAENLELPAGTIKTEAQEIRIRGKDRRLLGQEIARIGLVTLENGKVLTVGDLGTVADEFEDRTALSIVDGRPTLALAIERTDDQDMLALVDEVHDYVDARSMPEGYELYTWGDQSVDVRDRLELLGRNGLQGLVLVFIVLAIFLELRLAFWVALGIPISILGACAVLLGADQSLNMISMFAFLMVLGIVVDDAIVIGENIHAHRLMGKDGVRAAVDGTLEVLPSVSVSVATTILAFMPLFFVTGVMGKFIGVMPLAVVATLAVSLFEGLLILPGHLAHENGPITRTIRYLLLPFYPVAWLAGLLHRVADGLLGLFIRFVYMPSLRLALRIPLVVPAAGVAILILAAGLLRSGATPFIVFPKLDNRTIQAIIEFPDGTPEEVTARAVADIEAAIREVDAEIAAREGTSVLRLTQYTVGQGQQGATGGHLGFVGVELVDVEEREATSAEITALWRDEVGEVPGALSLTFGQQQHGPAGKPIEFRLLADKADEGQLTEAVERCKARLARYPGVFDIADDDVPGKWEYRMRVRDDARGMGVTLDEMARTVRGTYHGEEVQRLQRGRHEVKVMVRYPHADRRTLAAFEEIRIRTADGVERPITEMAEVEIERGPSAIRRIDQRRAITITADVDETKANAREIVADLRSDFEPGLKAEFEAVDVRWEGQQKQTIESLTSLFVGFGVALLCMFVLLTIEFRSYLQPLMILCIIPFGMIGAITGHALMGLPVTMFSMFGIVALSGIVINDSIVLIDFINHRIDAGLPVRAALLEAGSRRFRPVFLTSVTTIAGLTPILLETSFQAQILIPMATSIVFGLMVTTFLVLVVVPTFYFLYASLLRIDR